MLSFPPLSTPSLGITRIAEDSLGNRCAICFQLPLSGSREGEWSLSCLSITRRLSTPSLGITSGIDKLREILVGLSTPSLGIIAH
jgi:hypothetical protein